MKQFLEFAVFAALLGVSSATVRCDNYINNSTYQEAIGRWTAVYTWPATPTIYTDIGLTFHVPTPDEIQSHRTTSPSAHIDTLTDNPKLVARSILVTDVDVLLDISADEITRVKGYYNRYDYVQTERYKLRKIGEFLVVDYCENGKEECVSESAWMLHKSRLSKLPSDAENEAAACVVVPGTTGKKIDYRN